MARIRSIKPAFWASESLATRLPGPDGRQARLLFIGLWGLAEDLSGVLRGHPSRIRSDLFAYDDDVSAADIDRWLGLLEAGRFIVRYERDGSRYVWVRGFIEHQKIDKPSKSTLPEPSDTEKKDRSEPSPSPPRALPEPSAPEVGSRKGGGEEVEEDLPPSAGASAAPEQAGLPVVVPPTPTYQPAKKPREKTPLADKPKDPRHAPLVASLTAEGWPFDGGKDAAHVKALLALADQQEATRGELAGLEVLRRARIAWSQFPDFHSARTLAGLRSKWGEFVAPIDGGKEAAPAPVVPLRRLVEM